MANIQVKKNEPTNIARPTAPAVEWDPFRMMRALMHWDPFREMGALSLPADRVATFAPRFDVKETKDAYLFKADVPGVKESEIEITVTGNRLAISGRREAEKEEQTDTYHAYERSFGQFSRSFTLPEGADMEHVLAEMKDGVLTVTLPKLPAVQPKRVPVNAKTPDAKA